VRHERDGVDGDGLVWCHGLSGVLGQVLAPLGRGFVVHLLGVVEAAPVCGVDASADPVGQGLEPSRLLPEVLELSLLCVVVALLCGLGFGDGGGVGGPVVAPRDVLGASVLPLGHGVTEGGAVAGEVGGVGDLEH
jgi:hypothetical protein